MNFKNRLHEPASARIEAMVNVMRSVAEEWREAEDGYDFRLGAIRFRLVIASPPPFYRDHTRGKVVPPARRKPPLVVA